jgi:excinuclease UvrABC nuclease subunit
MKEAARNLEFERAAALRDKMKAIRSGMIEVGIKA